MSTATDNKHPPQDGTGRSTLAWRLAMMNRALARPESEIPAARRPPYEHCRRLLAERIISGTY